MGVPRSQFIPSRKGLGCGTYITRIVLRVDRFYGRHILSILLQLELIPDFTCGWSGRTDCFLEWEQGFVGGAEPQAGG